MDVSSGAAAVGVVSGTRRAMVKDLTAVVRSTLPEAELEAPVAVRIPEQDGDAEASEAEPVLVVRSWKIGPVRRRGEGPCRRVAQGRREAGPRRHGPWRGVRAEGERNEVDGIEAWRVDDVGLRRTKRAGNVSERRREGCLALTAGVRSTLPEAQAAASAVVRTLEGSGVREPVWGEAHTGDADGEGCADDERSEADGARDTGAKRRGPWLRCRRGPECTSGR